jgi:hypothetical protein
LQGRQFTGGFCREANRLTELPPLTIHLHLKGESDTLALEERRVLFRVYPGDVAVDQIDAFMRYKGMTRFMAQTLVEWIWSDAPKRALSAYKAQVASAKKRGISFEICFTDWWEWWKTDNRWERRGDVFLDGFVMARKGDIGPYAIWNIYCATFTQNLADGKPRMIEATEARKAARLESLPPKTERFLLLSEAQKEVWKKRKAAGAHWHLEDRETHPRAKPVRTPAGWFPSAALAAEHHGIPAYRARDLAAAGKCGWSYVARQTVEDDALQSSDSISLPYRES